MSDRMDELVAAIDANTLLQWDGKDVALVAAHELATIAREAEAMCEWLVEVLDEDGFGPYPNYKFIGIPTPDPLPESRKQAWLKAAREAVKR